MTNSGAVDVSVIIPLYNSQTFLENTVLSILEQSKYKFEIILIDDGSTDRTWNICKEIKRKYDCIKIFHQDNKGLCAARNFGIDKANGRYIAFCDHDDWFKRNLIRDNIELADKYDADIVKFGFEFYCGDNFILSSQTISDDPLNIDVNVYNELDKKIFLSLFQNSKLSFVWDGLFRKELLEKNNIRFDLRFKHGHEDRLFSMLSLTKANRIVINNNIYYRHMDYVSSTSNKYYINYIDDTFYLLKKELEIASQFGVKESAYFIRDAIILIFFYIFKCSNNIKICEREKIFKRMMKEYDLKEIGWRYNYSLSEKILFTIYYLRMYRMLALGTVIYKFLKR